jgi:hypothetical protein
MSHRLPTAALAALLALPAGAALAQSRTSPAAGPATLGDAAAPATMAVELPELSVRIPPADPATTGSIRPHHGRVRIGH